jgi:ubiquinone/menaquinone biosynthesis C-methylase UbiE
MTHAKSGMERPDSALLMSRSEGNGNYVRQVFENTARYLRSRKVDIHFRIDTVSTYAANLKRRRVLDIGCGDGTISLQLLAPGSRFTLIDISSSMVAMAQANIPEEFAHAVEMRNEDFTTASFGSESFDLVMAVGVMAHVDSPDEFLQKIKGLLQPSGALILEFTDAYHFVGKIGRFWSWLKELRAPAKYPTNKLSFAQVAHLFERHGLTLISVFRYSRVPLPGFNILVSHAREYRIVKTLFGDCIKNRNARLGNEYICLLRSA